MTKFNDNNNCFVCGTKNKIGLKLKFRYIKKSDLVKSEVIFPEHFQGWANVVHGGLISTVLDEIMIKTAEIRGLKCVTAEININFKKPALTKIKYILNGKIKEKRRKIIFTEASIQDLDNTTIATANAKLFIIN